MIDDLRQKFEAFNTAVLTAKSEVEKRFSELAGLEGREKAIEAKEAKIQEEKKLLSEERKNIEELKRVVESRQAKLDAQIQQFQNLFQR